jgi:hypothetical protein
MAFPLSSAPFAVAKFGDRDTASGSEAGDWSMGVQPPIGPSYNNQQFGSENGDKSIRRKRGETIPYVA